MSRDNIPVDVHVLAVDDDQVCLNVLKDLLKQCEYQVTTTTQASEALQILRANEQNINLVITDVDMPDIDGFQLLEVAGREMDLPVVLLSGNPDPKQVMKGIMHGACDYLIKPPRIEEMRNVWQHIIRKEMVKAELDRKRKNKEVVGMKVRLEEASSDHFMTKEWKKTAD